MMSGKMYRFRVPEEFVDPRFVEAFLQTSVARDAIDRMKTGGSDSGLNLTHDRFRQLEVPLAPTNEQRRIVDAYEELTSDLDAGVVSLEQARAKLKAYRASVLKAAVDGTLTAEWREEHPYVEPASALLDRILAERRRRWEEEQFARFKAKGQHPPKNWKAKYAEAVLPETSDLPALPASWCWASLDQLASIAGGITKGQKLGVNQRTREVPYLRVANVQRGYLDLSEVKTIAATEADIDALRLMPGDVLFNEGGDRDKLGRGWVWQGEIDECIHQNHVFRARLLSEGVQPKFVSWCGNSYGQQWFMRHGKQSVNLASINLTVLRSFPVPLAPASEQEVIVEIVEDQLSVVDHLEADLDAKLKAAQSLRQSILRHAFTGQLVPQDPHDEPASELLKRIAAEREARGTTSRKSMAAGTGKPRRKPAQGAV
jgi:type I restriction enzyme, S subunit